MSLERDRSICFYCGKEKPVPQCSLQRLVKLEGRLPTCDNDEPILKASAGARIEAHFPPVVFYGVSKALGILIDLTAPEVGIAKFTDCGGAILLAAGPQIAASEA